jgi:histidine triad (HIT) family protein
MDDCIFCKIIRGEIPSSKVYEDERVLAFDDINPAAPVHVVVIPKQHIPTLMDVQDDSRTEYLHAMMAAVPAIARLKGIAERGFRVMLNCNREGGQVIFHLHLHVLGGKTLSRNPD